MIANTDSITDVEVIEQNLASDATLAPQITAENAGALLNIKGTDVPNVQAVKQPTQEQIIAYMKMMRDQHNAKCRKKGFKDHIHQPAGHKLERKLARQGSLYGRLSLIDEMMKDISAQKFKDAKENHAAI